MGNPNFVHPDHYRIDWNWDFLRLHPDDSCPAGWEDSGHNDGMCNRVPEETSNFYTKDQFRVQYEYPNGYTVTPRKNNSQTDIHDFPTFKGASMNPFTGNYMLNYDPKPNKYTVKYGELPSRSSYLGK
jgi:hypothetical protein